jgi:N-acetylneuraminic acid mutarotase
MAYIGDDKALLFGGKDDDLWYNDTWVYDFSENTWTDLDPPTKPAARTYLDMAYLGGDQVLKFGGYNGEDDTTWVFDLSENNWTNKNPSTSPTGRYGHAMSYIGEDKVLMHSGYTYATLPGHYLDDLWVYDLSDNNWTELVVSLPKPDYRVYHKLAYIGGDRVLLFGGWHQTLLYVNDTWIFDLSEGTWTEIFPAASPTVRHWYAMASIDDSRVIVFGGNDPDPGLQDDTWVYFVGANTWVEQNTASKPSPRREVVMADLGGNHVLLFGGRDDSESPTNYYGDTWTFNGVDLNVPVELSSFTATGGKDLITLEWTTESEQDNEGFHIYRRADPDRLFERINPELIPGAGNCSSSRDYHWKDRHVENGQTYWYQLESVDFQGRTERYGPISAATMTSQPEIEALPATCRLFPNYPNPFNPETWISYQLSQGGHVSLEIYNVQGQLISVLMDRQQEPGLYRVRWDGRGRDGTIAASGLYFCRLKTERLVEITKMILIR